MNYFDSRIVAERYSEGRPHFHNDSIRHIKDYLKPEKKWNKALDIACGTGLSTKALLEIADEVYGTDASREMLNVATAADQITYIQAPAEKQPFADNFVDLVTVSSGVHWFNIDAFLSEAYRLLKPGAWLVLYENHFIAEMPGNDHFATWFHEVYLHKFPSPPRNNSYSFSNENMEPKFKLVTEQTFKNEVRMTKQQLILYFTTQSNIIAAVEQTAWDYEQVESWLNHELRSFFNDDKSARIIHYGNWMKFLQRSN